MTDDQRINEIVESVKKCLDDDLDLATAKFVVALFRFALADFRNYEKLASNLISVMNPRDLMHQELSERMANLIDAEIKWQTKREWDMELMNYWPRELCN